MVFKKIKFLFWLACVSAFLFSCSENNSDSSKITLTDSQIDQQWVDSLIGGLSAKQKYYQHLIIEVPAFYQQLSDTLVRWIVSNQPGAIYFENWNPDSIQHIKSLLDTFEMVQPLFYGSFFDMIESNPYPFWETTSVNRELKLTDVFHKSGFGLLNFDVSIDQNANNQIWLDSLLFQQGILGVVANFDDRNATSKYDEFLSTLKTSDKAVKINLHVYDTINFDKFRLATDYEGLFVVKAKETGINKLLLGGADFVYRKIESPETFTDWLPNNEQQIVFDESTKRILAVKNYYSKEPKRVNLKQGLNFVSLKLQAQSTALLRNKSSLIPFKGKFTVYANRDIHIDSKVKTENSITFLKREITTKAIKEIETLKGDKLILIEDSCGIETLKELSLIKKESNVLLAFSNLNHYDHLKEAANLLFYPPLKKTDYGILFQQLTSRLVLKGNFFNRDTLIKGIIVEKKLLARTHPNFCAMDSDTLARISSAVNNAMSGRAFPGCQVLIAKDGCIIYDRCFGHHTYSNQHPVTENSLYDLASLTKIVSTTLMGMKLYELKSYQLKDSLKNYLPDSLNKHLRFPPSTIRNITFQELMIHKSGLPSGFPIIRYMRYTNSETGRYDKYYCDRPDSLYNIEVAENYFMEKEHQDSMWLKLNQIILNPSKEYKYSDVNMNTLYFIFKSIIQKNPEKYGFNQPKKQLKDKDLYVEYLYKNFYEPLGMNRTCYKPLKKFNRNQIVPTENETFWRKQLLHGHVHDPNAALHGGVAGNAGIFSTANDLAILCQMWLNKGVYNGRRYLEAETIDKFTARQENSHRGLGFNKPAFGSSSFGLSDNASMSTYGHTGFTGTCIWLDPEYGLTYIFLSNRVHPDVNNRIYQYGIRKRIHQFCYDAMMLENF